MNWENFISAMIGAVVGGSLSLIGTWLANHLQQAAVLREWKRERMKERFTEVRRYLTECLELVDLISVPTVLGEEGFGKRESEEWKKLVADKLERWQSLPVSSSARVLYVEDKELLQILEKVDSVRTLFYINYRELTHEGRMVSLEEEREELKRLAASVAARLDQLLDEV